MISTLINNKNEQNTPSNRPRKKPHTTQVQQNQATVQQNTETDISMQANNELTPATIMNRQNELVSLQNHNNN
jgi:hypothetical protein